MSNAVLILIDGLRPDAIAAAHCPNLTALQVRGSTSLQATSVMPTITLPCHTSIFHSVPPTRHGITSNDWSPMARPIPGLVDVAAQAGRRCAFFFNWEQLRDLSRPGNLALAMFRANVRQREGDQEVAEDAARALAASRFDFAFVYLGVVDEVGHEHGWMSEPYLAQVERADRAVGTVMGALSDDTTLLVQADHGGHDRFHGTDLPDDITIPWLIAGPRIRQGYTLPVPVSLLDTTPTLAHILGLTPHRDWEGRVVTEIFGRDQ